MLDIKELTTKIVPYLTGPIVIWDIETTSANTKEAEIVQFYAVRVEQDSKYWSLEFMCKPKNPVPQEAIDIHGITNEMLKTKKPFKNYINQVVDIFNGVQTYSGYNISYDVAVLGRQLEENNYPNFFDNKKPVDVFALFKEDSPRKLANAVEFYTKEPIQEAHSSSGDTISTLACLVAQLDKRQKKISEVITDGEESKLDRYFLFNGDREPVFAFGKYNGKLVKETEKGYISWIVNKSEMSKGLKVFLAKYL